MPFCPNCSSSVNSYANFCPNCGSSLNYGSTGSSVAKTVTTVAGTAIGLSMLNKMAHRRHHHHMPPPPPPPHCHRTVSPMFNHRHIGRPAFGPRPMGGHHRPMGGHHRPH